MRTDDLNLSEPAGPKTLQARLRSAERTICSRRSRGARSALAEAGCLRSIKHTAPSLG
ncbi:UrcA family protein [Sphingopyxis sp. A083]|uniref:UrcA family protein n=1 Tax=Sphingopyxis sp. A083 TaxID=1759083 RepID=UPI003FA72B42